MDNAAGHAALTLTDENFATEVKQFNGVVLVDFWASWCPPCIAMGPRIEELAQKYASNPKVKIAKLDADAQPATAQEYGIMSLPTFLFFVNGQDVDVVNGLVPPQKLEEAIQKALQKVGTPA